MNRFLLAGLVIAILTLAVYVVVAAVYRKRPELADGVIVFIGAVSVAGAIRLLGCALTGQFVQIARASTAESWWALSSEDSVFVAIGAVALAWVSVQTIWQSFSKLLETPPAAPSGQMHSDPRP